MKITKITSDDFSTNRKMLNGNVLRYCENFASYCGHIVTYLNESLNEKELRWVVYLIQRIELFVKCAPSSEKIAPYVSRYQRVLTRLKKLENENNDKNRS